MANKYFGDVKVSTGTYEDKQTGQEKKRWLKIGAAFKNEEYGTIAIKLDALPMAKPEGTWLKIFEPQEQSQQAPQQAQPAQEQQVTLKQVQQNFNAPVDQGDPLDDIPF